jgi:hypothetical protein
MKRHGSVKHDCREKKGMTEGSISKKPLASGAFFIALTNVLHDPASAPFQTEKDCTSPRHGFRVPSR